MYLINKHKLSLHLYKIYNIYNKNYTVENFIILLNFLFKKKKKTEL